MSDRVSNFSVLDAMAVADKDVRLAPLGNILNLQKVRAGTAIRIGVEGDVVAAIGIQGRFVGGLILADKIQFYATKQDLERRATPAELVALLVRARKQLAAIAASIVTHDRIYRPLVQEIDRALEAYLDPGEFHAMADVEIPEGQ